MSIVTLDQARTQLGYRPGQIQDDDEIQACVDGITTVIEEYKNLIIEPRTVTEDLELCGSDRFMLRYSPVISLTSVVSFDGLTTWNVANLAARPSGRVVTIPKYTAGPRGDYTATYQAGYSPIPTRYVRGALVMLQQAWELRRGTSSAGPGLTDLGEGYDPAQLYWTIRKARIWLGDPGPGTA